MALDIDNYGTVDDEIRLVWAIGEAQSCPSCRKEELFLDNSVLFVSTTTERINVKCVTCWERTTGHYSLTDLREILVDGRDVSWSRVLS